MEQDEAVTTRAVSIPPELNPFLIQVVALGVGNNLIAACEAAHAILRKRATQVRTKLEFPTIHGMYYALTNHVEEFSEPGKKKGTTATLAAWYHLDFERNVMTPLPHRLISGVSTNVIVEYDVVFCEGY
jgi:hypothetical protein